jgi:hypothetical protein
MFRYIYLNLNFYIEITNIENRLYSINLEFAKCDF